MVETFLFGSPLFQKTEFWLFHCQLAKFFLRGPWRHWISRTKLSNLLIQISRGRIFGRQFLWNIFLQTSPTHVQGLSTMIFDEGQPVQSNTKVTSTQKGSGISIWPTQWDMQLSPAQALTLSCQSCGVQISSSDLRDTYGRSFVVKPLDKINQTVATSCLKIAREINLPRLASIFRRAWICHS